MELSRANLIAPGGHSLMEYAWYFDSIIQLQSFALAFFIVKLAICSRHDIWSAVAVGCAALASGLPLLLADGLVSRFRQKQQELGSTNARPFMARAEEKSMFQKLGMGINGFYSELKAIAVISIILAIILSSGNRCVWFVLISAFANIWILCSVTSYSFRRSFWLKKAIIWLM